MTQIVQKEHQFDSCELDRFHAQLEPIDISSEDIGD